MDKQIIILDSFHQQVTCCCPEQKHQHRIGFHEGDIWTVTNDRKYVDCLGWHVLIENNNDFEFYIHVEDIEELRLNGKICSAVDIDLELNHSQFKVNEALDQNDRETFIFFANKLRKIKELKNKLMDAYAQTI